MFYSTNGQEFIKKFKELNVKRGKRGTGKRARRERKRTFESLEGRIKTKTTSLVQSVEECRNLYMEKAIFENFVNLDKQFAGQEKDKEDSDLENELQELEDMEYIANRKKERELQRNQRRSQNGFQQSHKVLVNNKAHKV